MSRDPARFTEAQIQICTYTGCRLEPVYKCGVPVEEVFITCKWTNSGDKSNI